MQISTWTTLIHGKYDLQFFPGFFVQDVAEPGPSLLDVWTLTAEYV